MNKNGTTGDTTARHKRIKLVFKIIGPLFLAVAAGLIVTAFVDFFTSILADDMKMPRLFWMFFVAVPFFAGGFILTVLGFRRELARYVTTENAAVFNEMSAQIRPGVGTLAATVHGATASVACVCGQQNDADDSFCKTCGLPLKIPCPHCRVLNDGDAKFCDKCGKPI